MEGMEMWPVCSMAWRNTPKVMPMRNSLVLKRGLGFGVCCWLVKRVKFGRNVGISITISVEHIFRTSYLQDTSVFHYHIEPEESNPIAFFLDHFIVLHTHTIFFSCKNDFELWTFYFQPSKLILFIEFIEFIKFVECLFCLTAILAHCPWVWNVLEG